MNLKAKFFLFLPLLWFLYLWVTMIFNIHLDIHIDGLFYNADQRPEEPVSEGLIPDDLFPLMFFLVSPIMFFIGSIYTAYKKYWVWFGAYMILGGGLWVWLGI